MNTPLFAASHASTPLLPALRGIIAIIGGFEVGYDPKEYRKLPQIHELPYPPLDIGDFDTITLSCQEVPTIHIIYSFLTYSYNPGGVAEHLWELLIRDEAIKQLLDGLLAVDIVSVYTLDSTKGIYHGIKNSITLTPHRKGSWEHIAQALARSTPFQHLIQSFSRSYLENLLIPFMTRQPPPPISPITTGHIQSAYKGLLTTRDGHRTVVGGVWDYNRPDGLIINDIERQEEVEEDYVVPTHVIPYFAGGGNLNPKLRYYMQRFCGGDVGDEILMESLDEVNSPRNGLLLTPELYTSFRKLRWCIEVEEAKPCKGLWPGSGYSNEEDVDRKCTYKLRLLTRAKSGGLHLHNDKDVLHFGESYDGMPSPRPLYCNVHASMAKVLRASGAGGAVEAILRNEQTLKEEASTGANWGDLGRDYLVRRLSAISDDGI
ncbi:hypothetical protein ABW19_dt0205975 [Dactylella cylindrospora]|nr:hypothetical protein ABW19_dt0205975 [Dactylella cylindrospora]